MSLNPPPVPRHAGAPRLSMTRLRTPRHAGTPRSWRAILTRLARAREGNTGVLFIAIFPALIGFGLVCVDGAYLYFRNLLLHQTVQAAALAAGNRLSTYYSSGNNSSTAIISIAQTFTTANMPAAQYGTVVPAGNVVLGNWDSRRYSPLRLGNVV